MSLIRQNLKVLSLITRNVTSKFQTFYNDNIKNNQKISNAYNNILGSWFQKKETSEKKPKICKYGKVYYVNPCGRLLPECPQFIGTHAPSKCLEDGYGKPIKIKRRSWLNFNKLPRVIKEKPTNNPKINCPKEETLKEYIFGPEKAPVDVRNCICKKDWLYRVRERLNEPRLIDPDYRITEGDVYVYTEPQIIKTKYIYEPEPMLPRQFKLPLAVICKKISDCYNTTRCREKCTTFCLDPCKHIPCPLHSNAFEMPYEEMRPLNPRRKFFSCKEGITVENVERPRRREDCTCMHSTALTRTTFPPNEESRAYQSELDLRCQVLNDLPLGKAENRKMSRCERLKLIEMQKKLKANLTLVRRNVDCEVKRSCKVCPKSKRLDFKYTNI